MPVYEAPEVETCTEPLDRDATFVDALVNAGKLYETYLDYAAVASLDTSGVGSWSESLAGSSAGLPLVLQIHTYP
ncbi:MAG: hypothetical protein ABSF89_15085 [Acidimicrobiales bacterium]|jgi:hypothetical protein